MKRGKENSCTDTINKRFVGIKELAVYLDVKVDTIRSWVWQGKIPYFKMGRLVKFDLQEIGKWLREKG